MTYLEYINGIIAKRGQWGVKPSEYFEGHHIVPRCLGGTGSARKKDPNVIWLYPEEHFVAHKLLAEENPGDEKLALAWSMMVWPKGSAGRRYEISAEDYAECRAMLSESRKGHATSDEARRKMSESQKKRFESESERKRAGACHIGVRLTKEHRRKISESNSGKRWPAESRAAVGTKVCCVERDRVYSSAADAFRDVKGIDQSDTSKKNGSQNILLACRGSRKTAYGFHWRFADESYNI